MEKQLISVKMEINMLGNLSMENQAAQVLWLGRRNNFSIKVVFQKVNSMEKEKKSIYKENRLLFKKLYIEWAKRNKL